MAENDSIGIFCLLCISRCFDNQIRPPELLALKVLHHRSHIGAATTRSCAAYVDVLMVSANGVHRFDSDVTHVGRDCLFEISLERHQVIE